MTVRVIPVVIEPDTRRWVSQYRLIGELLTPTQQATLDVVHTEALSLSVPELMSTDPALMSANGFPVAALRVVRIAYEHMKALGQNVDLLSPGMTAFMQAAKACGVFGLDSAAADLEIARIVANETPAAT